MIGFTLLKNKEMGKKSFHAFDRTEIHNQAFVDFTNGALVSGHSSSSTFHDFTILSFLTIKISYFQIFKFKIFKVSKFRRLEDSLDLEKIILFSLIN